MFNDIILLNKKKLKKDLILNQYSYREIKSYKKMYIINSNGVSWRVDLRMWRIKFCKKK